MRRALLYCAAIAFAIACGDSITEPIPDRTPTTTAVSVATPVAFATTTTEDGLSISTDKDDYQPGDTVHFTGSGWQPEDVLDIVLTDDPLTHDPHTWSVNVEPDGMFHDSTYVVDEGDLNVKFTLVATSRATGRSLTVQFTDNQNPTLTQVEVFEVTGCTTASPTALVPAENHAVCGRVFVTDQGGSNDANFHFQWVNPIGTVVRSTNRIGATSAILTDTLPASLVTAGTWTVRTCRGNFADVTTVPCTGTDLTRTGPGTNSVARQFVVPVANVAPNAPADLAQFRSNGTTSIATGGATNETSVVLKGVLSDLDAGNTVKLQVEVKPVGTAFTNAVTAESALLASGSTAAVTVSGLTNGTSYHWQARAVDNNVTASSWVSFGGNSEADADFLVDTDAPGVTINKAGGQADPTKTSPINFTAVFSKPVIGFTASDVTISGTASTTSPTVTGGPATYNVAVPVTTEGTVIATIAAGVATDAAGNDNVASTSTDNEVIYDVTPPVVTNVQASPNPSNGTGNIVLTATATDALTKVTSAEYNIDGGGFSPMATSDVGFDELAEDVTVTISAATLTEGSRTLCVRATDDATNRSADAAACTTLIVDRTPPVVSSVAVSPNPTNTGNATLTATATDALTNIASAEYQVDAAGWNPMSAQTAPFDALSEGVTASLSGVAEGTHQVCVRATDAATNTSDGTACVTLVVDKTPPVVSGVSASPNPTNTGNTTLTATATDALTNITSAEYQIDAAGWNPMSAQTAPFDALSEGVTANLSGVAEGTHQVCVRATDAATNTSDGTTCVTLIVDQTPPAISNLNVSPNPVAVNTPFTISATFIDALTNVTGGQYSLGGTGGPWVTLPNAGGSYDSKTENGSSTLSLPNADVLDVCVRSTDQAGNTNQTAPATNPIQCIFLAVYDPSAGFVTGGGWIDSPNSACPIFCAGAVGKATFGFVSKYITQKDKTTPVLTGNTEFQFHAGNVNFKSTNYEWLVVSQNGTRAQYKGTGTMNGQAGYGFLLTALDDPDKFRIKIWDAGGTIYDNQWEKAESGNDATLLGGGSIIIHVPKK